VVGVAETPRAAAGNIVVVMGVEMGRLERVVVHHLVALKATRNNLSLENDFKNENRKLTD